MFYLDGERLSQREARALVANLVSISTIYAAFDMVRAGIKETADLQDSLVSEFGVGIQVLSPDWILSFRIKCVGLEVTFGPHQWWSAEAVLDILEGH